MENKKKYGSIMIDIETMATGSMASIVSIGAVEFNMNTGDTGKEFYVNISLQSCIEKGLKVDGNTVMWWMAQSDEARNALTVNPKSLEDALVDFSEFLEECDVENCEIYGNGPKFDLGILTDAYEACGASIPWKFWMERCVRTVLMFLPHERGMTKFNGTAHNALDDCHHQIKYCTQVWKKKNNIVG